MMTCFVHLNQEIRSPKVDELRTVTTNNAFLSIELPCDEGTVMIFTEDTDGAISFFSKVVEGLEAIKEAVDAGTPDDPEKKPCKESIAHD